MKVNSEFFGPAAAVTLMLSIPITLLSCREMHNGAANQAVMPTKNVEGALVSELRSDDVVYLPDSCLIVDNKSRVWVADHRTRIRPDSKTFITIYKQGNDLYVVVTGKQAFSKQEIYVYPCGAYAGPLSHDPQILPVKAVVVSSSNKTPEFEDFRAFFVDDKKPMQLLLAKE